MIEENNQPNNNRNPITGVSEDAGRLRRALIVLLVIIFWSITALLILPPAQTTSANPLFPEMYRGFLPSTLRGILRNYLSLRVLLFTLIPLISARGSRKLAERVMHHMHPDMTRKQVSMYLSKCCFSSTSYLSSSDGYQKKITRSAGGPAEFPVDASHVVLIERLDDYFVLLNNSEKVEIFSLEHGSKILAEFPHDKLFLNREIDQFTVGIEIMREPEVEQDKFLMKISSSDARFLLSFIYEPAKTIQPYLQDVITAAITRKSILTSKDNEVGNSHQSDKKNNVNNRRRFSLVPAARARKGLVRRRSRSIGKFFSSNTNPLDEDVDLSGSHFEDLTLTVNEKVKYFFRTEHIRISIQKSGDK